MIADGFGNWCPDCGLPRGVCTCVLYLAWEEHLGEQTLISISDTEEGAQERITEWNKLYNRGRPLTAAETEEYDEMQRWICGRRAYCITKRVVDRARA